MSNEILVNESGIWVAFHEDHPLDFNFYDDYGNAEIYIQNEDSPGRTHHLVVSNKSHGSAPAIILERPENLVAGATNYHFELRFRPGTLVQDQVAWISIGNAAWRLKYKKHRGSQDIAAGTISLYLLYVDDDPFAIAPRTSFMLPIQSVKAAAAGGSRGSRVELRYNLKIENQTPVLITANEPADENTGTPNTLHYRQELLNIVNQRGIQESPFIASLVNGNTILNDGTRLNSDATNTEEHLTSGTDNQLELKITNRSSEKSILLCEQGTESPTRFVVSFDTSHDEEPWALGTPDQVANIDLEITMESVEGILWQIKKEVQGKTPQWVISVLEEVILSPQEDFTLDLTGIKSSMPSGVANLYLQYENIPNYWDGEIIIPIEKSSLRFRDLITDDGDFTQNTIIGIGTMLTREDELNLIADQPNLKLIVDGDIKAKSIILTNADDANDPSTVTSDNLNALRKLEVDNIEITKNDADELRINSNINTDEIKATDVNSTTASVDDIKISKNNSGELNIEADVKIEGRVKDSTGFVIPPGGIIMWSGASPPEGWALCDGTNFTNGEGQTITTPDLRSRFIVGAGQGTGNDDRGERLTNYTLNSQGGRKQHVLSASEIPKHKHDISVTIGGGEHSHQIRQNDSLVQSRSSHTLKRDAFDADENLFNTRGSGAHTHTVTVSESEVGNDGAHENRPPYYVLAFIMKK